MKYVPACLAVLCGLGCIALAMWITKDLNCLWGLVGVIWLTHVSLP